MAAAFAHGLAPLAAGADGHAVEICTADGLQTTVLEEDGKPPAFAPHFYPGEGRSRYLGTRIAF
ncbi:hypothetical protein [Roseicella aerolata]|uniref:Uncharacterized protein n=1 Tax=Roseicella aerolata TaxID=2883479 RepID=A0A9X1IF63_9PROT|nr:hypothetical protein [Roseicella aerolata]MCB4823377.1 hypothetical protein [Roseicella aerolata]